MIYLLILLILLPITTPLRLSFPIQSILSKRMVDGVDNGPFKGSLHRHHNIPQYPKPSKFPLNGNIRAIKATLRLSTLLLIPTTTVIINPTITNAIASTIQQSPPSEEAWELVNKVSIRDE